MITWDNAKTTTQKFCQDSSVDGRAFQELMLNAGYKEVLVALERQQTELQAYLTLEADRRDYPMPPDCLMPKSLTLVDGTNRYPLIDVSSDLEWEYRIAHQRTGRPVAFHFRPRLGLNGGVVDLDPIPSDTYSIELTYEATERDLSQDAYTTGLASLTHGSAAVSGSGMTFVSDMVGRYFMPTAVDAQRLPYRISDVTDATHMTLENVYHGPTDSSVAFEIFEMFSLPEDCHMLPCFYAAWQWWDTKGNTQRANKFQKQYVVGLDMARQRHALTTRNNIIAPSPIFAGFGPSNPEWFPESVI